MGPVSQTPSGTSHTTASEGRKGVDGIGEGRRIERMAVAHAAEVGDADRTVGNRRPRNMRHFERPVAEGGIRLRGAGPAIRGRSQDRRRTDRHKFQVHKKGSFIVYLKFPEFQVYKSKLPQSIGPGFFDANDVLFFKTTESAKPRPPCGPHGPTPQAPRRTPRRCGLRAIRSCASACRTRSRCVRGVGHELEKIAGLVVDLRNRLLLRHGDSQPTRSFSHFRVSFSG